jgi:hypothetical protein
MGQFLTYSLPTEINEVLAEELEEQLAALYPARQLEEAVAAEVEVLDMLEEEASTSIRGTL